MLLEKRVKTKYLGMKTPKWKPVLGNQSHGEILDCPWKGLLVLWQGVLNQISRMKYAGKQHFCFLIKGLTRVISSWKGPGVSSSRAFMHCVYNWSNSPSGETGPSPWGGSCNKGYIAAVPHVFFSAKCLDLIDGTDVMLNALLDSVSRKKLLPHASNILADSLLTPWYMVALWIRLHQMNWTTEHSRQSIL